MNNDNLAETGHEPNKKSGIFRYSIYRHTYYPSLAQLNYVILGLTGGFIALLSILLHELGHSAIAKKYGIKFDRIVLFAFGGVALIMK